MKDFLKRLGVRLMLVLFVPYLFVTWLLAFPYMVLDWGNRRQHLRDGVDLFSRDSWADLWAVLTAGGVSYEARTRPAPHLSTVDACGMLVIGWLLGFLPYPPIAWAGVALCAFVTVDALVELISSIRKTRKAR